MMIMTQYGVHPGLDNIVNIEWQDNDCGAGSEIIIRCHDRL